MKLWRVIMAGVTISLSLTIAAKADLSTQLVSFWPLDEIDGTSTPDFASSNIVNLVGAVSLVPGPSAPFTNAFSFPASPVSYFTTAGTGVKPSGLPIYKSANGYSVAFWVKAPPQISKFIYTESSNVTSQVFSIGTGNSAATSSNVDIFIRTDNGTGYLNNVASTGVAFDNTWHHIGWTDNHGTCALYIDGNLDPKTFHYTPTAATMTLSTTTVGNLVRNTIAVAFNGSVDNVAAWQRVLTQAEIQQFMTNSIPLPIVQSAPILTSISPDSTNALGDFLTLGVSVGGSSPIGLQWYLGGTLLPNQTNGTLLISPLVTAGTNLYSVVASNYLGSITNTVKVFVPSDPPVNFTNGIASYWPLDTIVSTNTPSTTPDLFSRNDFLLLGTNSSATSIAGQFGNALSFDSTQFEAGRANGGVPVFTATNYTVSMWVNAIPGSQQRVFAESSTNSATPLFTIATDPSGFLSTLSILIRNDANTTLLNNLTNSLPVFDGSWHHIVWVDKNGHVLLYVDNVLDPAPMSYTRTGTFTLNTTAIGGIVRAAGISNPYSGGIDEVAMWNRALTYTEVLTLQSNTVPTPTQILPPTLSSLTVVPADPTNNLYVGNTLTFTAQVGGTAPLAYQWLKNGAPVANATAGILSIPNAQTTDSGAYSLTVSNGDPVLPGGAVITTATIQANVQAWTPVTNGLALALDVDALGSPNTQPGFQMYNSSLSGLGFTNGVKVTIAPFGTTTALSDRLRAAPTSFISNTATITQAQLYNDFEFGTVTSNNTGLTILLERLAPSTPYGVTIWSYDSASAGSRISDWTETFSGAVIKTGYSFNGSVQPTADYDDTLGALLTSTASGKLQIKAVIDSANVNGVAAFVNAIQLVANPTVSITSAKLVTDGNFQITVQSQFPGETTALMSSPDLSAGSWQPITNSVTVATHGPITTFEIPPLPTQQFFKAVVTHP